MKATMLLIIVNILLLHIYVVVGRNENNYLAHHYQHYHQYQTLEPQTDLSIWISEQQVKVLSGYSLRIFAIENGRISHFLRDPAFDSYLPIIPPEVSYVNFTWSAGKKKYRYHFDKLTSLNEEILQPPIISIKPKGKIPQEPKQFSVMLPCSNLTSGIAKFSLGLLIIKGRGKILPGTPLRFTLRKECSHRGPDPECDKKCLNNGFCTSNKICKCSEGYLGRNCEQALCFPQCLNGGNCTAPAMCSCPKGFQGRYCEGGICTEKCLNGGKCIQKDTCQCPKGYYGLRCELSKCVVPCLNGGKCRGTNICKCVEGWSGNHCEIRRHKRAKIGGKPCGGTCRNGFCRRNGKCKCNAGYGICKKKCLNGGKCVQKDICSCSTGYYGLRCQFSNCVEPCFNGGKCIENNVCECSEGWFGNQCELKIRMKREESCRGRCQNGGHCSSMNSKCKCKGRWTGQYCQISKWYKSQRSRSQICKEKCLNGGKCVENDTCNCPPGYYGLRCEFSKCDELCFNGGKCIGKNVCECSESWFGNQCEMKIRTKREESCAGKCQHGGHCTVYNTCWCRKKWTGTYCTTSKWYRRRF